MLRKILSEEVVASIKGMKKFVNGLGAAFDIPEEHK